MATCRHHSDPFSNESTASLKLSRSRRTNPCGAPGRTPETTSYFRGYHAASGATRRPARPPAGHRVRSPTRPRAPRLDEGGSGATGAPPRESTPFGDARALDGCRRLWEGARSFDGGLNLFKSIREPETCITGMLVALAAAFGDDQAPVDPTVEWLVGQQLADGGWNCESIRQGSRHGSFHTSITVLEALLAYQRGGGTVPVSAAMVAGRRFFLDHHLYLSHRTGQVVDPAFCRFPFPPQWHFDVMRGLEHFRAAGADRDARLEQAVEVIRRARQPDGTWPMYRPYPGRYWFQLELRGASRWSTLRALRVLGWWDESGLP